MTKTARTSSAAGSTSSAVAVAVLQLLLLILACATASVSAKKQEEWVLKYYVHILVDGSGYGSNPNFLPVLNKELTADFGEGVLFALNATEGVEEGTSKAVGYSRGYTVETSYVEGVTRALETVVIEYNDGEQGKVNGSFVASGIVGDSGANELAILGGTGTFRGASGYLIINFARSLLNNTFFTFAHEAHFFHPRLY